MSVSADQESAAAQKYLPPKLGMLPAVTEETLLLSGSSRFPKTTSKDVKPGDLCYVVYTMELEDGGKVNWGYLGEVVGVDDTHVRYHLSDVHKVVGSLQALEACYVDVPFTDTSNLFRAGGPTVAEIVHPKASKKQLSEAEASDEPIANLYENKIDDVVESCGKKLMEKKKSAFYVWLKGPIMKNESPNPTFKLERWKFTRAITEKIATSVSINAWQAKGLDAENFKIGSEEVNWLESDFLTPVLAEKTSAMSSEDAKKTYQAEVMPNTPTILKYVIQMVDNLVSGIGPHGGQKEDELNPGFKQLAAELKELKASLSTLVGATNAIATQLKIREVVEAKEDSSGPVATPAAKPAAPEATIIPVPGEKHECAYHVMSVAKRLNDGELSVSGTQDVEGRLLLNDGTLVLNNNAVDKAKLALLVHAKECYETDTEQFEALMGFKITALYEQVLEIAQSEKTWATEMHLWLHANEHPDVELKLKTFRKGTLATIPTRQEGLPAAKLTMFAKWRPGHFELIGIKGKGSVKIAFTQSEVHAAELAIDTFMTVDNPNPDVGKLNAAEFRDVVWATLQANRALGASEPAADKPPAVKKHVHWAPTDDPAPTKALLPAASAHEQVVKDLQATVQANQKQMQAQAHLAKQALAQMKAMQAKQAQGVGQPDLAAAGSPASLVTFAQEQVVKNLQADVQAQRKQMQAQAQLALQARAEMEALQAKLLTQQSGAQHGPKTGVTQVQGVDPLDMIIDGSVATKPGAQPVLIIWSDAKKKKIEQVLNKLNPKSFKAVQSIEKVDSGTPNAHHVVRALAQDVPTVQHLLTHLLANGVKSELYDPTLHMTMPSANSGGFQQVKNNKGKPRGLAGKSQKGLTTAIGKAGQPPPHRVNGQCDYYSAQVGICPRGDACRFACYNGPAKQ
jgi:hypothetical protein